MQLFPEKNAEKDALEQHLSVRTNELFDIEDKIMLYDLTNTYFEGRKEGTKLAQYVRSKEKRNDAKLVVLALVVNPEGFIKYSSVLDGNMADSKTLEGMINKLRIKTSVSAKRLWWLLYKYASFLKKKSVVH